LIALDWSVAHPERLRAIALSAPALEVGFTPPPWKVALARFASRIAPTLAQSSGIRPEHISSVLEEIEAYRQDPQIHDRVSARHYVSFIEAAARLVAYAERLEWPTLVLVGGDDTVVSVAAVRRFAESNPSRIEFRLYPGARHEIFHEASAIREAAASDLIAFLSRNLRRGDSS
jgi:alpha-beta hydrolase superfamily lysophospholipase